MITKKLLEENLKFPRKLPELAGKVNFGGLDETLFKSIQTSRDCVLSVEVLEIILLKNQVECTNLIYISYLTESFRKF